MLIGIMGAPIDSDNLGCMALTYSLLSLLDEIEKENDLNFEYLIFSGSKDKSKVKALAGGVGIDIKKIHSGHMGLITTPLKVLRHIKGISLMLLEITKCDCIIDLTEGDSFSDIYGDERFIGRTKVKELIEKINKPLLLGPQTYGPFIKDKNKELATKVIKDADVVVTRDSMSKDLVNDLTGRNVFLSNDLAFKLPYDKNIKKSNSDKLKIGINVSGLLSSNQVESIEKGFKLSLDYDKYIDDLLTALSKRDDVEIYMIPHVGIDNIIHEKLKSKFPGLKIVSTFSNPIEVKNYISQMDVFIGARMHGTIAAFTAGVPCIPTAYSRKFSGLFEGLGYNYVVDLQKLNNEEALNITLKYIDLNKQMCIDEERCLVKSEPYNKEIKNIISSWLIKQNGAEEKRGIYE